MYLYISTIIASTLSFSAGVSFSWTSPMLPKLTENSTENPLNHPVTTLEQSWITALISIGSIFGPPLYSLAADKLGRKKTLILLAFPMLISLLIMAFAKVVLLFLIARFIMGLGAGSVFTIVPMYLVEIAEDHNRGALSTVSAVFVAFGLLFTYTVGYVLSVQNFCLVCAAPLVIFIPTCWFLGCESPLFLISKNQTDEFRAVLSKLRRNKTSQQIENEISEIRKNREDSTEEICTLMDFYKVRTLRKGLVISCGLISLQQLAGISAIIAYLQPIFDSTGSSISSQLSVAVVGVVQFIIIIITSFLVDTLGRKLLLLVSTIGTFLSLVTLGFYFFSKTYNFEIDEIFWVPIASLMAYIVFLNFGLGPLPWTVTAELFPVYAKAKGAMITSVLCMTLNFFINFCFPPVVELLGMGVTFGIFAVVCIFGVFVIWKFVPETKGKSIRQIQDMLSKKSNWFKN